MQGLFIGRTRSIIILHHDPSSYLLYCEGQTHGIGGKYCEDAGVGLWAGGQRSHTGDGKAVKEEGKLRPAGRGLCSLCNGELFYFSET